MVTPILGTRVLLISPLVRMEATIAIVGVRGIVRSSAIPAVFLIQVGLGLAPTAMRMLAKVNVMKVMGAVH